MFSFEKPKFIYKHTLEKKNKNKIKEKTELTKPGMKQNTDRIQVCDIHETKNGKEKSNNTIFNVV